MKWPWVSGARYDRLHVLLDESIVTAKQALDAAETAQALVKELLDIVTRLKLSGASIPEPKPEPVAPKEPDIVTQAIISKAGSSRILRNQFSEFVNEQRALGVEEQDIAAAIIAGVSDDGGVPG